MEITQTIENLLSRVTLPIPEQGSDWLDPIQFLETQHREVEALFKEIENLGDKAYRAKEKVMEAITERLTLHAKLEEKVVYPAAKKVAEDLVLESFEEHDAMKDLLKKLKRTKASDARFGPRVKFLKEIIEHHVKEEESDLFPKINSELPPEQINQMGTAMQRMVSVGQRKVVPKRSRNLKNGRGSPRKSRTSGKMH
jgi:hemerythrin superfamily protein